MRYAAVITAISSALFCAAGCVEVSTPDVVKATDNVKKAATELSEGMKTLQKVDPLGYNRLLVENDEFRKEVGTLRGQLAGASEGTGLIVLKGHKVRFDVPQYTGSLRVSGWIDAESNWFTKDVRLDDKKVALPVDYNKVLNDIKPTIAARVGPAPPIPSLPIGMGDFAKRIVEQHTNGALGKAYEVIPATYQAAVSKVFETFLKTSALIPAPSETSVYLQDQFLSPGSHIVGIVVTPQAADSGGRWSIRVEIVSVAPDGKADVLKRVDVDSDMYANSLKKPLQPVLATLVVRTTPQ